MNYSGYYKFDCSNGEGVRCTLFVSGCNLHCKNCFNKETWKYTAGELYTKEFEDKILNDLDNPYIQGLSLLGGDPCDPKNIREVISLCQRVKKELPSKDIWVWTGRIYEDLKNNLLYKELLDNVDILVDGKFQQELYEPDLLFRGSHNQKIILVQESLASNKIVLYNNGNYK